MNKKDLGLGIVSIVVAAAVYFGAADFSGTARFFPRFIATCVAILGALIVMDALRGRGVVKKTDGAETAKKEEVDIPRVIGIIALLFAYYVLFQLLGYIIPTFLLVVAGAYILEYKNLKVSAACALLLSVGLYFLFAKVFYVSFPGLLW